jgi:hypothetical protein
MLFMVNLDVVRGMRYGLCGLHRSLKIQHKLSLLILAGPTHGPRRTAQRPEIPAPFREPGRGCPWLRENQVAAMAGSGHLTEPAHGAVTASGSTTRFGATRVRLGEINGLAVSQHAGRSRECGAHETRFTVVVRGRGAALIAMGQQAPDGPLNAGRNPGRWPTNRRVPTPRVAEDLGIGGTCTSLRGRPSLQSAL